MVETEVAPISDVLVSTEGPVQRIQNQIQKTESVTRNVWLRLPKVNPNVVRRLRRLYTRAIRQFIKHLQEGTYTEKQIYHELRKNPNFAQLPARMLDRAGREAYSWFSRWKRERYLADEKLTRWRKWAKSKGINFPKILPGLPQLMSYSPSLKGWPGSQQGQWPQTNLRLFVDSETQAILVSIDKVVIKTHAIIGGQPEALLRQAIAGKQGYSLGTPRLIIRNKNVYLAVPVTVKVNVPKVENLTQPTIIGVDLGLNTLAAAVAMSSNGRILPAKVVSGRRLKHQLNILWGKRRAASRKNLKEKIETIDKKTRYVIQYWVNVAAKTVIRYAIQFSQSIIVLEDLRSYLPTRKGTPWAKPQLRDQLSKWARGEIGRAIKRNSALEGIPTVFVDAAYSSHICPRGCLCLLTKNPKTNRTRTYFRIFSCPNCGVQLPRDINAAIEIAKRGLHLIKERVKME